MPQLTPGQTAYEADRVKTPRYHDGGLRPEWSKLSEIAQWSWERAPSQPVAPASNDLSTQKEQPTSATVQEFRRLIQGAL